MNYKYSHTYVHPDSRDEVDVGQLDGEDDPDEIRNAKPARAVRRTGGRGRSRRTRGRRGGGGMTRSQSQRVGRGTLSHYGGRDHDADDRITLRKSALIEIIPAAGALWASFLARPEMPDAVGDHVVDRNNAAKHRDALARHQQNQTRILALSELAERALNLFAA